jgi:hypothetical protein
MPRTSLIQRSAGADVPGSTSTLSAAGEAEKTDDVTPSANIDKAIAPKHSAPIDIARIRLFLAFPLPFINFVISSILSSALKGHSCNAQHRGKHNSFMHRQSFQFYHAEKHFAGSGSFFLIQKHTILQAPCPLR